MSYPAQIVYVDLQSSRVFSNQTGEAMTWPSFVAGGVQNIGVRFLTGDGSGGYVLDSAYSNRCAGVRCGLGVKDYSVESGQYRLVISEGTTADIPYSANSKRVQDSLNALVSSNLFSCEQDATGIYISRANGSDFTITSTGNALVPSSFIAFRGKTTNGRLKYKMTFEAAPLAFTTGGEQILPPPPVISVLQHGGTDSGGAMWPTIQNLFIPPTFQGTFQLTDGIYKSDLMDITDGASQIQANLNKMWAAKGPGYTVTVTNPTSFNVHITFNGYNEVSGGFMGTDVPPLLVPIYSAPPADWTIFLNLDTIPLQEYLRGQNLRTLQFEAEADFYVSTPLPGQPLPATFRKKLWSMPVTVTEPLIRQEFQTAQAIEWLEPPSGKTYIPFSPNQIITGQQNYTTVLGDGSATSFVVAHNLNTDNLASILVRENKSSGRVYRDSEYQVIHNDLNSLTLIFAEAPEFASLAVAVTTAGPISRFLAHNHTIEQVENLGDRLNELSKRIAYLENLVPSTSSVAAATNMPDQISVFPSFGEILPDLSLENTIIPKEGDVTPPAVPSISAQIVTTAPAGQTPPAAPAITVIPGTDLQKQTQEAQAELAKIQAQIEGAKAAAAAAAAQVKETTTTQAAVTASRDKTLVTRFMIPAIGTSSAPMYWPPMNNGKYRRLPSARQEAPIAISSIPSSAGVYRAITDISLPGGSGRRAFTAAANSNFAFDGKIYYGVASQGDDFWYPIEMDRELSRTLITESTFPEGSILSMDLNITTMLLTPTFDKQGINNGCAYRLRAQAFPISGDLIEGAPSLLFETTLGFSTSSEQRVISLSAKRDGSNSTATIYGKAINGAPVPDGDFALLVDLTRFDVDSSEVPVGQLGLVIPASQIVITNG